MIFAAGARDVGSSRVWQSRRYPDAPRGVATSCITQPPLAAIAVERVAQSLVEPARAAFVRELFPKLVAHHEWLYRERVVDGAALVTLIHPWECGLDSTPPWMQALREWPMPWWLRVAQRLRLARILRSLRYDTRYLPATERASDDDGLRMLALAVHARKFDFELQRMPRDGSVMVEDIAFNAMLAAANRSLLALGDVPDALERAITRHHAAIEDLWDDATAQYCSRHTVTGRRLTEPSIASFLPLWAGAASPTRAAKLVEALRDPARYAAPCPVPSVPLDAPEFQESRYWKGPTWVNMNWAIIQGLEEYGDVELAQDLRRRTLEVVDGHGFSEYFSPLTGEGYGADEFSWTAALTIELIPADA